MSQAWSFPSPHGPPEWPGWALSITAGRPLDSLDPKLLMRLGPALADELARLDAGAAPGGPIVPGGPVYIAWDE